MSAPDRSAVDRGVELSLVEKVALLNGADMWRTHALDHAGIPAVVLSDGPHGVRRPSDDGTQAGSRPATCFPPGVALGCSWDPGLLREVGQALGREARAQGAGVLLGPGVNVKRSPLCGRNFEYLSEDPHLSGVLGAALVSGIQDEGVGASVKHFAAHNQETDRFQIDVRVDERTLREIYLPAFEHIVREAHPATVMCAYHRLNGTHAAEHRWLLTQVLREEWGYAGVVVSDWGAVDDPVASIAAGLDLEMPASGGYSSERLLAAVRDGVLDECAVTRAAARVAALAAAVAGGEPGVVDPEAHHRLARDVAAQCVVLLQNDGVLPLPVDAPFVVIGELARSPRIQGAGSSEVNPTHVEAPLAALRDATGREIAFAPGYRLDGIDESHGGLLRDAQSLAATAPVTVLFLGLPPGEESEGFDRTGIELPAPQRALLHAVADTGTAVVVVLTGGGVVSTWDWRHRASAVVAGSLLGQGGGGALADVLVGAVNPSGRLAESVPRRLEDVPTHLNFPGELGTVRYGEGVFVGYRYYDTIGVGVDHPFGHGLSYTTFSYSDLRAVVTGQADGLQVLVSVTVTNTGERTGKEVVQVYVAAPSQRVRRPVHELRAVAKPELAPGESIRLTFSLGARDLAYYDQVGRRWHVESGVATIEVGASSRDIRLRTDVEVCGHTRSTRLTPDSSLEEWLSDPSGRRVLERTMRSVEGGPSRFLDPEYARTIASAPLRRLARFPGTGLDVHDLDRLAAEANAAGTDG